MSSPVWPAAVDWIALDIANFSVEEMTKVMTISRSNHTFISRKRKTSIALMEEQVMKSTDQVPALDFSACVMPSTIFSSD
eukprot:tig00020592_g11697.t1